MEGERFQGGSQKIESDSCGGIGSGHGESRVRFSLEGPVGDPDLHVFLGDFYLSERASAEFFGKKKAAGANIRDREMGKRDVTNRPSGVGLGGDRLKPMAEKGEFVAVGVPVFIVEVSSEVPPLGFEFWVGSVIAWE